MPKKSTLIFMGSYCVVQHPNKPTSASRILELPESTSLSYAFCSYNKIQSDLLSIKLFINNKKLYMVLQHFNKNRH